MTRKLLLPLFAGTALLASAALPTISWRFLTPNEKAELASTGKKFKSGIRLHIENSDSIARLCFNQLPRQIQAITPGDSAIELVAGYYCIESPRFGKEKEMDIDLTYVWNHYITAEKPESFHILTPGGRVIPIESSGPSIVESAAADSVWFSKMTSADSIYRRNLELQGGKAPKPFDIVPKLKNVKYLKGKFKAGSPIEAKLINHENPEYYRIILTPGKGYIEGASRQAIAMGRRTLERRLLEPAGGVLPCAIIEDWPDLPYRGVLIDIARSYHSPREMRHFADLLADYRMNRLHFHLIDDEAWRLEIPGLPELTEVGSRRGYTVDSRDFLPQIYAGDGNPDSGEGIGNGYFTRRDFLDFISYCDSLGIAVIPEVESPGHSRAAIKAMEARYRNTGDDTYRLIEDGDTSKYTTAQYFHDNLMNPAMPGPYRFMEKIVDEIAAMYREAGVELKGIHIGGDEVPKGAWDGSPAVAQMEQQTGKKGKHQIHGEFVRRVAEMMRRKGIPMYGWQDICIGYKDDFNREVAPGVGGMNCWVSSYDPAKNVAIRGTKAGYPVILSNVDYFYMDMIYDWQPEEEGLKWGGAVDEFRSLSGYPSVLCPAQEEKSKGKVIGVSGQLFGETIRSQEQVERMLFPKMFGLAERGWNSDTTYSEPNFCRLIGDKELPRLSRLGVDWHLRYPGITIEDGKILMNSPYDDAQIRYTLDGSRPGTDSELYSAPIELATILPALSKGDFAIRAILVKDGHVSKPIIKKLDNE